MSVGLLIVAHQDLGSCMLRQAVANFGPLGPPIAVMEVAPESDPEALVAQGRQLLEGLDEGDGVLILTDLYGATPSNLAHRFCGDDDQVVHGLNLAMLARARNYRDLPLGELAAKLLEGGRGAIFAGQAPLD